MNQEEENRRTAFRVGGLVLLLIGVVLILVGVSNVRKPVHTVMDKPQGVSWNDWHREIGSSVGRQMDGSLEILLGSAAILGSLGLVAASFSNGLGDTSRSTYSGYGGETMESKKVVDTHLLVEYDNESFPVGLHNRRKVVLLKVFEDGSTQKQTLANFLTPEEAQRMINKK